MVMEKPLIKIQDLEAGYQGNLVLSKVSLSIMKHDFIGIIGPNGGGKTTLLKVLMGLMKPLKGTIEYGIDRTEIGYLPQGSQLDESFPITVREVVGSGLNKTLKSRYRLKQTGIEQLEKTLNIAGLQELQNRPIGALSGGELQRTFLARAIVSSPKLLVLDEPDTHVDNRFELELYHLLRELNQTMTILLVSHDIGTISPYIKSIACVNRDLHYHASNEINEEQLKVYNCPIEIITHGTVPHRVMKTHKH
jgi:zinc transport system ATP-binding protein